MSYPIIQNYITRNRSREALKPIGMVIHDTATAGATDEAEQSYFNNNNVSASVHAFIDWDSIIETVPDNEVSWGSGYTSNHKFLQVEMCVPGSHDASRFQEIWNRTVWYFAYKFVNVIHITTITKDNLMSHAEVSYKWHETDHTDPIAFLREYGKTVDDFRNAVQEEINKMVQPQIKYQAQVQNIGWIPEVSNGATAGTEGKSLRLETLGINVDQGDIEFSGHVQNIGWQSPRHNGEVIGTVGRGLRLESVKIKLVGLDSYSVQYQVHQEGIGWSGWYKDGEEAGLTGRSLRLEAIRIKIVNK